ncbi:hypothetical protein ACJZL1_06210 [Wolbachia endosymbiont of Rhagoletis indifferens]|uniref:hypothetical protein n=1 Tax=Wolbachia endosymbiont of Rhagoletis indifferens TaxID=3383250 RepID=UPI003AF3BEFB
MQQSPLESRILIISKHTELMTKGSCFMLKQTFLIQKLDPSGLCCIATEKIWWLLTKFIIK